MSISASFLNLLPQPRFDLTGVKSPIQVIPKDVIKFIFSFLGFSDLPKTVLICKSWKALTLSHTKQKVISELVLFINFLRTSLTECKEILLLNAISVSKIIESKSYFEIHKNRSQIKFEIINVLKHLSIEEIQFIGLKIPSSARFYSLYSLISVAAAYKKFDEETKNVSILDIDLNKSLTHSLIHSGFYNKAFKHAKLLPGNSSILKSLSLAWLSENKFRESIAIAEQIPNVSIQRYCLAKVFLRWGEYKAAIIIAKTIKEPLEADEALREIAVEMTEMNKYAEVLEVSQLTKDPNCTSSILIDLYKILAGRGEYDLALKVARLVPNYYREFNTRLDFIYTEILVLMCEAGQYEKAIDYACNTKTYFNSFMSYISEHLSTRGHFKKAVDTASLICHRAHRRDTLEKIAGNLRVKHLDPKNFIEAENALEEVLRLQIEDSKSTRNLRFRPY